MSKIPFHHCDVCDLKVPHIPSTHVKVELLSRDVELVEGRPLARAVFVTDDSQTRYVGLKASDFYLENLLEAGVDLKSAFCTPSSFQMLDSVMPNVIKLSDSISKSA